MAVTEDLLEQIEQIEQIEQVGREGDGSRDGVLSLLQRAVRTIDSLWHDAQAKGENPAAVALGEASYGVHRALIALRSDPALFG